MGSGGGFWRGDLEEGPREGLWKGCLEEGSGGVWSSVPPQPSPSACVRDQNT